MTVAREADASRIRAWITPDSLENFAPLAACGSEADGAALVFEGRVRATNEGREVSSLAYEAYAEMAEQELEAICGEALDRFAVSSAFAAHRVGELGLKEVSVVVKVAAPHREPCYAASRWIIEALKSRLPVWKHERYADGSSVWVGAPAAASGAGP